MKIKRITKFKFPFIILFSLIFIVPSYNQSDTRNTMYDICEGGGKSGSLCGAGYIVGRLIQTSSDEIEVTLPVHVTKRITKSDDSDFIFPEDYPTLYLRYEYSPDEYRYTGPVNKWFQVEEKTTESGDVYYIYRSENKVRIQKPEVYICEAESSSFTFTMDSRFFTFSDETNEWEEYPVYEYAGEDDVFSCNVFKETMHICDSKLEPMEMNTTRNICVACPETNDEVNILANPFSHNLIFNYLSKDKLNINVMLYSTEGATLFNEKMQTEEGVNRFQLPTSGIPSGTYFLSVFNGKKNFMKKVVCVQ